MIGDIWYRIEERRYAPIADELGERRGPPQIEVALMRFKVIKETPKGVWLSWYYPTLGHVGTEKRFVRRDAHKRFACPTLAEARESFRARKTRQQKIFRAQLRDIHLALSIEAVTTFPDEVFAA